MSLRYKIMFSVDILHEYYSARFCHDFEFIPSQATSTLLKGHGLIWKSAGHKLIVLARTDSAGKLLVHLDPATKFCFYLKLNQPHFNNFSNLSYQPSAPKRYYFSNIHQTKLDSSLYLSAKIARYDSSNEYTIAGFASHPDDTVFEAIKPSGPGDAQGLANTAYWTNRGRFQYVSREDLIEFTTHVYSFTATAAGTFTIDIFGFNAQSGTYDLQVMDTVNLAYSSQKTTIPVRLDSLPSGQYRIQVNAEEKMVYYDAEAIYRNMFAVVEVSNHLPPANDFSLVDASGAPKSPVFTIRFANRSVIWKYLSRTSDVSAVEDTAAIVSFASEAGNLFVSDRPMPLQEKPLTTISLKSTAFGDISPLANPSRDRLSTLVRDGHTYLCSEIHLNY